MTRLGIQDLYLVRTIKHQKLLYFGHKKTQQPRKYLDGKRGRGRPQAGLNKVIRDICNQKWKNRDDR